VTRLCVLADSHAAAIKLGWPMIEEDFPDVHPTFFAGTSTEWNTVRAVDGKLVSASPMLKDQFRRSGRGSEIPGDFDAYIVYSIGLAISVALKQWVKQEQKDWEAHRAAVAMHVRTTNCAHTLGQLRKITAKPVLLIAAPFQPHAHCLFSPSLDDEAAAKIRETFFAECEALAADHGAAFFPQPQRTWAPNGVTTKMKFASTERPDGREDRRHCTPRYGAILMRAVLESGFGGD
jgi:hypothetical protein